jgi:SWI/SNF-related matrix-associated actin-dependent regulator 1 of chromatin subfamily A
MIIEKTDNRFHAVSTYKERNILKNAGFWWNSNLKCWWTDSLEIVSKVIQYADDGLAEEINQQITSQREILKSSRALDSNIEIPAPEGKSYLPFQKAGIEFIAKKTNSLVGDEMGLGKSVQTVGLINLDQSIKKVLIVCPASLKLNWKKELEAWLVREETIEIVKTKKPFPESGIVIINFDILEKFQSEIRAQEWDLLVVDEAHYLKGLKTRRTQQVVGKLVPRTRDKENWEITPIPAKRKLFLTGTPIVNRPSELWPILHTLDPVTWDSYDKFAYRYCAAKRGRFGWEAKGAANLEELQIKLRSGLLIRRLKADVLSELPPKRRQIVELSQNGARKIIEAELEAFERYEAALHERRFVAEISKAAEDKSDYAAAVERLKEGVNIAFGEMAHARQETAIAKVPYVLEFLENVSDKVVIFAHHKEVVKQIKEALGKDAVVLDGSTSMTKRNEAVERFQNDPKIRFFIGSIQAAGVGLTLTAASHAIFVELDWTPAGMCQAEDRLHRIGQQNSVLIQHLVFDQSVDANIAKTLVQKQAVIDAALDNELDEDLMPVTPLPDDEDSATAKTTFKDIAKEAPKILPETIIAIHSSLRYLANLCDGAKTKDGRGFNSFDAEIGQYLARQKSLTPKQAALGRKILRKYSKQLGPQIMEFVSD